jgi:cytochrome c biogenesis protein CcmG/thiol:disulfide interchange protein DsbE
MLARLLGGLLTGALLAGCVTGETDATRADPAAAEAAPAAPACEELPEKPTADGADTLPPLTLPCLGPGPDIGLDRLTGRPTLVNLWATWCEPCREEMPLLQDAYVRHGDRVRFLGVDVQDDAEAARWFLDEFGITYPHAADSDGALLRALGMRGLPVTLVLDEEGRVVGQRVGQLTADTLQELIDPVLT